MNGKNTILISCVVLSTIFLCIIAINSFHWNQEQKSPCIENGTTGLTATNISDGEIIGVVLSPDVDKSATRSDINVSNILICVYFKMNTTSAFNAGIDTNEYISGESRWFNDTICHYTSHDEVDTNETYRETEIIGLPPEGAELVGFTWIDGNGNKKFYQFGQPLIKRKFEPLTYYFKANETTRQLNYVGSNTTLLHDIWDKV